MNAINIALCIRRSALIKSCASDHIISCSEKEKRKPKRERLISWRALKVQARATPLITAFVIKPGYLPEQPSSHVPGESATHFLRDSARFYSMEVGEREAIGSPFPTRVSRSEGKRKERRERRRPWARNLAGRGGNGAQVDHSGERGLRCIPAPMSTNEQLGRQDQSYWSGLRLFSQGWLVCLRLCYGCYSCGQADVGRQRKWM